jgi:glutaredoxin
MKKNIISIVSFVGIILIIAGIIAYVAQPKSAYSEQILTSLAQAIASKGITMYGAEWCPHCQAQKALFGKAFSYVPYVECPKNEKICLDKGVRGYPTWITPDGTKYEGEQNLAKLAELSGFSLTK